MLWEFERASACIANPPEVDQKWETGSRYLHPGTPGLSGKTTRLGSNMLFSFSVVLASALLFCLFTFIQRSWCSNSVVSQELSSSSFSCSCGRSLKRLKIFVEAASLIAYDAFVPSNCFDAPTSLKERPNCCSAALLKEVATLVVFKQWPWKTIDDIDGLIRSALALLVRFIWRHIRGSHSTKSLWVHSPCLWPRVKRWNP